jgi:hypothetical protein
MAQITNTNGADLDTIFKLFDHSISYQERKGAPVWKNYDKNAIIKDIEGKNQYKIVINSRIAIVFSVCYTDKVIWRDREQGNAVYLHRVVVNPEFKGQKLFGKILDWVIQHAKEAGLTYIRMTPGPPIQQSSNIIKHSVSISLRIILLLTLRNYLCIIENWN